MSCTAPRCQHGTQTQTIQYLAWKCTHMADNDCPLFSAEVEGYTGGKTVKTYQKKLREAAAAAAAQTGQGAAGEAGGATAANLQGARASDTMPCLWNHSLHRSIVKEGIACGCTSLHQHTCTPSWCQALTLCRIPESAVACSPLISCCASFPGVMLTTNMRQGCP